MIRGRIKNVMIELARMNEANLVRADQDGDRQVPPFVQYKILNEGRELTSQTIESRTEDPNDPDMVLVTVVRKYRPIVSITVVGTDYDSTWELADSIKEYLDSEEGKEFCASCGVFPVSSTDIGDRTTWLETETESRLGFDAVLDAKVETERRVAAIDVEALIQSITRQASA